MSDFCLVRDDQCRSHFASMCKVIWYSILSRFEKKIVFFHAESWRTGNLHCCKQKKKSPTMCCKVLCCNAFRDFCKFYLPSLLQIVQIGEIFCNSPRTGTSYNLSQCLELRYYSGEVDLGELYHLYQDIIYFVSIRKKLSLICSCWIYHQCRISDY